MGVRGPAQPVAQAVSQPATQPATPADPVSALLVVPFGPALAGALAGVVARIKRADVMAPATVVVPSAVAGMTLRRTLAAGGGLVNVRFTSLPELAAGLARPRMAAGGRVPLGPTRAQGLAASVLSDDPGVLAAAASEPSTARALTATFADLDELEPSTRARLVRSSRRAADVVRLHRAFLDRLGDRLTSHQQVLEAAAAVDDGADLDEIGTVILHAPRRLRPGELELLAALSRRQRLDAIVAVERFQTASSADPPDGLCADEPAVDLLRRLEPLLGAASYVTDDPRSSRPLVEVARAIDPAEEARVAVRRIMAALDVGVPADRIAVVARVREPYHLLLHEELAAAAIPHRAPATHTLAQSVAGRTLLGLLHLAAGGYQRAAVMSWLRSAPIVDPATGRPVPAPWWDRLAREAGVAGGLEQWRIRLARAIERREERRTELLGARAAESRDEADASDQIVDVTFEPPEPDRRPEFQPDPRSPADPGLEPDRKATSLVELAQFIDGLAERLEPPAASWRDLARWAGGLLDTYLDGRRLEPGTGERSALDAVEAILGELGGLDGVGPPAEPGRFPAVVANLLDRPAASVGTLGQGVVVGSLADLVGADVDVAVIVGGAEGQFPPARVDDPLLPNRERRAAGVPGRGLSPAEEHRDLVAAMASADRVLITTPRADPRNQREAHPARWLLDVMGERLGRTLTGADLDALAAHPVEPAAALTRERAIESGSVGPPGLVPPLEASWFTDVVSFEWWLASGLPPGSAHEHDVAEMLQARNNGLDARRSSPARATPVLAKGLAAVTARAWEGLGPWTGLAGPHPELVSDLTHPQSSTALEHWVVCPFRYFLGHVLRVDEHDDPADTDWASGMVKGSLYHAVLEQFVGEAIERPHDQPWSDDDRVRLHALADDVAAGFEAEGRTGRPLLWELSRHEIHRQLDRILDDDDRHRSSRRLIPVAVEHAFGFDDAHPPVRVVAGEGQEVVFRGFIDRIDRTAEGDRLVVLDYKTGSPKGYPDAASGDLTANGRYLQLLVYAAAARAAYGDLPVESYYWFVGERGALRMRGGEVDAAAEARLREVLGVLVDGVAGGRFPARPGQESFFGGFDNCRWCPYDRVCSTDRAEQWQRVRLHPGLTAYRALVEPDPERPEPATPAQSAGSAGSAKSAEAAGSAR